MQFAGHSNLAVYIRNGKGEQVVAPVCCVHGQDVLLSKQFHFQLCLSMQSLNSDLCDGFHTNAINPLHADVDSSRQLQSLTCYQFGKSRNTTIQS